MKCIALVNEKGGVGKSTLAINLACALSNAGAHVVLVDADPQGTARKWIGKHPEGYTDAFDIVVLDTPAMMRSVKVIDADIIIIDTPAKADLISAAAIRAADIALIPLQPSGADIDALAPTVQMVHAKRELGGKVNAAFVLNRITKGSILTRETKAGEWNGYDIPILESCVSGKQAFAKAITEGLSVYETDDEAAMQEIDAIIHELRGLQWL